MDAAEYKSCQELMIELSDINRRLNGLVAEYDTLHKQIAGLDDTELDQAAKTTLEIIDQLKADITTDHTILNDKLNGEQTAGGKKQQ